MSSVTVKYRRRRGKDNIGALRLNKVVSELSYDSDFSIKVSEWKDTRSNLQNAFIHVCFDVYGNEIGYTPNEAKYLLKKWYGVNTLAKNKQTGKQELIVRSTTEYSVQEMATFIDRMLKHFEYDCGIVIDSKIRKQYKLDEITGELEEI